MLIAAVFAAFTSSLIVFLWQSLKSRRGKDHEGAKVHQPVHNDALLSSKDLIYKGGLYHANDLEFCKKILNSSVWINRLKEDSIWYFIQFGKPLGLIWGGGRHYKRARAVTTKLLHRFSFYKSGPMEELVMNAAADLRSDLRARLFQESSGNSSAIMSPHGLFQPYVLSIVWQFMFGGDPKYQKVSAKDPVLLQIRDSIGAANKKFTSALVKGSGNPFGGLIGKIQFFWLAWCAHREMFSIFREIISERREDHDCQPDDFLNGLLEESNNTKGGDPEFTEESVLAILRDIIIGSSETVSDVLEFVLLHVALNRRIQEKVQAEIDLVVGDSALPSYIHRARMIYTQAVLLEALRYGSVVQVGTRVAKEDTFVDGVYFPKDSVVVIKPFEIHRSKVLWDDPDVFRPERFIADNDLSLVNTEKVIPFGFGKRSCVGEQLGQLTLFIFFVTVLQNFRLHIPEHLPPPSMKTQRGFGRTPEPYYLQITPRLTKS